MKGIYKMNLYFRRMGGLRGVFIAEDTHVKELINSGLEVYFGEVLGKHSEVWCEITAEDLTLVSQSPEAIKIIETLELESGYNPFEYTFLGTAEDGSEDDMTVHEKIVKIIAGRDSLDTVKE